MSEHGIACALRWKVALVGVYPTGHCSPRRGTPFRYREYAGGRRILPVPERGSVIKKAELWLVITFFFFCKEAWNKLVLACILCKNNRKNTLEQPCSNL